MLWYVSIYAQVQDSILAIVCVLMYFYIGCCFSKILSILVN
jgi:hypothetical protein